MEVSNRKFDRELALQEAVDVPFRQPVTWENRPDAKDGATGETATSPIEDEGAELNELVQWFEDAEEQTNDARQLSERDRDYFDSKQWTEEESAILRKRGQPELTVNYIKRKVETMRGYERRMRSDPKAFPRNPQDEQTADAATDSLRYIADQNDFDVTRSLVYENLIIEGYGAGEVIAEQMPNGEIDVRIINVPWDRVFYDPHSRKSDFSDANYKGIVIWMDAAKARRKWGERADAIDGTMKSAGGVGSTYDDRPTMWCDNRKKRVRVVQMHYLRGDEWMVCTFTKGGFLEPPEVSPYTDKYGRPVSSLIMRSAYIDRKNNRYGAVRDLISIQDEINKRRSKALHLMSVRQTFGNAQAITDTQKARLELAKPDGHIELNGGSKFGEDFGTLPTSDMAQGQVLLMQQAVQEMQGAGANEALAGKGPQSQSGRAWEAQQQAGAVNMEPLNDELRQWTRDVYEAAWLRVRQFWTDEKWVRVTDDERNIKFVGLNKKVTVSDRLEQMDPAMRAQWMQQNQMQPNDPRLQEVIGVENDVSGIDVDIVIEEGPNVAALQSEQFQTLADLAKNGMPIPPKAIIQASSLRNKDQLLDDIENGKQLPPAVQKQMEEMKAQLDQLTQQNQKLELGVEVKKMDAEVKMRELDIKERESAATANQQPQGPEPVSPKDQADAILKSAEAQKTLQEAEQIRIENAEKMAQLRGIGVETEMDDNGQVKPSAHEEQLWQAMQQMAGAVQQVGSQVQALALRLTGPKQTLRDESGKPVQIIYADGSVQDVNYDGQGRIVGVE